MDCPLLLLSGNFFTMRGFHKMKQEKTSTGWRIKAIPYRDPFQPMETNWWAVGGSLCFISGIVLFFLYKKQLWLFFGGAGFLIGLLALLLKARWIRRNWKRIQAKCIDQEIRQVYAPAPNRGKTWCFQILCEFELDGCTYLVTPIYWRSFVTETGVSQFLAGAISPEGLCELHVNPNNPLQTELIGKRKQR